MKVKSDIYFGKEGVVYTPLKIIYSLLGSNSNCKETKYWHDEDAASTKTFVGNRLY